MNNSKITNVAAEVKVLSLAILMLVSVVLSIISNLVSGVPMMILFSLFGIVTCIVISVALIIIYSNARNGELSLSGIKTIKIVYQIKMWITVIFGAIMFILFLLTAVMSSVIMEYLNKNADEIASRFIYTYGYESAVSIRDFLQGDYAYVITIIAVTCMIILVITLIFAIIYIKAIINLLRTVMKNAEGSNNTCKTGFISFILIAAAASSGLSVLSNIGKENQSVLGIISMLVSVVIYIIGYMLLIEYKKIDFSEVSNNEVSNISEEM